MVLRLRRYERISIEMGVFAGTESVWPKILGTSSPQAILHLGTLG